MVPKSRDDLWTAIHTERPALAEDLAGLDDARWAQRSLCGRWTVEFPGFSTRAGVYDDAGRHARP